MRGIPIYRMSLTGFLRVEFTKQTSQRCMDREVPPPDIRIPLHLPRIVRTEFRHPNISVSFNICTRSEDR
jgi:hypothetical protein